MKLNIQKRLAADVAGVSSKRIKLDITRLEDIKESITKHDIRGLIKGEVIKVIPKRGISRGRARKIKSQKSKGRRKGPGSIKGATKARVPQKEFWMNRIRKQRALLKELKTKKMITTKTFTELYSKSKGGFFRSKRHLKIYIDEHNLVNENVNNK
jgi:large subunit ribosomal protein L19e